MPKKSKKHHYNPQFYLKGFLNENKKLYVFDKKINHFQEKSPVQAFFELNLNRFKNPDGTYDTSVEDFLSKLESKWSPVLKKIEKLDFNFSIEEGNTLIDFISWQIVRAPSFIAKFEENAKKAIDTARKERAKEIKEFTAKQKLMLDKVSKNLKSKEMNLMARFIAVNQLYKEFLEKALLFFVAPKETSFLVSDSPYLEELDLIPLTSKVVFAFSIIKEKSLGVQEVDERFVKSTNVILAVHAKKYIAGNCLQEIKEIVKVAKQSPFF